MISGNRVSDVGTGVSTQSGCLLNLAGNWMARAARDLVLDAASAGSSSGNLFQGAAVAPGAWPDSVHESNNLQLG